MAIHMTTDPLAEHERWLESYNTQRHWAHEGREDGRRSPSEVLGSLTVVRHHPEDLSRAFFSSRFIRKLDALGYARFRRWRVYAEEGLARLPVALWLGEDDLTVQYGADTLSSYDVSFSPGETKLRAVTNPRLFATRHQRNWPQAQGPRTRRVRRPVPEQARDAAGGAVFLPGSPVARVASVRSPRPGFASAEGGTSSSKTR